MRQKLIKKNSPLSQKHTKMESKMNIQQNHTHDMIQCVFFFKYIIKKTQTCDTFNVSFSLTTNETYNNKGILVIKILIYESLF